MHTEGLRCNPKSIFDQFFLAYFLQQLTLLSRFDPAGKLIFTINDYFYLYFLGSVTISRPVLYQSLPILPLFPNQTTQQ